MITRSRLIIAALSACVTVAHGSGADVLFRDDFNDGLLDLNNWVVNPEFRPSDDPDPPTYPGTQTRDEANSGAIEFTDTTILLPLELFNPTANTPGDSFYGTDLYTKTLFHPGTVLRARLRLNDSTENPLRTGYVAGLFFFETESISIWDEIDFELLSNDVVKADGGDESRRGFITNVYDEYDTVPFESEFNQVSWIDLTRFNTFTIKWLTDRVEWIVSGEDDDGQPRLVVARTETDLVPDDPMHAHVIIHAPGPGFVDAHDPAFLPVDSAELNEAFFLEIDFVEVTALLSGDADDDGAVTADDLISVQQNFGNTGPRLDGTDPGDADDDGTVTADDLIAVQQNFGAALSAFPAPVPEPAAAIIAIAALAPRPRRRIGNR